MTGEIEKVRAVWNSLQGKYLYLSLRLDPFLTSTNLLLIDETKIVPERVKMTKKNVKEGSPIVGPFFVKKPLKNLS